MTVEELTASAVSLAERYERHPLVRECFLTPFKTSVRQRTRRPVGGGEKRLELVADSERVARKRTDAPCRIRRGPRT